MPMLSKTRSFHSRCHFPLKLCSQWVGFCFFSDPTPCKKQVFFTWGRQRPSFITECPSLQAVLLRRHTHKKTNIQKQKTDIFWSLKRKLFTATHTNTMIFSVLEVERDYYDRDHNRQQCVVVCLGSEDAQKLIQRKIISTSLSIFFPHGWVDRHMS